VRGREGGHAGRTQPPNARAPNVARRLRRCASATALLRADRRRSPASPPFPCGDGGGISARCVTRATTTQAKNKRAQAHRHAVHTLGGACDAATEREVERRCSSVWALSSPERLSDATSRRRWQSCSSALARVATAASRAASAASHRTCVVTALSSAGPKGVGPQGVGPQGVGQLGQAPRGLAGAGRRDRTHSLGAACPLRDHTEQQPLCLRGGICQELVARTRACVRACVRACRQVGRQAWAPGAPASAAMPATAASACAGSSYAAWLHLATARRSATECCESAAPRPAAAAASAVHSDCWHPPSDAATRCVGTSASGAE
jgi:hypothetical protein